VSQLQQIATEYFAAVGVISESLREFERQGLCWFRPSADPAEMAAAIIARLASHDPPILLDMQGAEAKQRQLEIGLDPE